MSSFFKKYTDEKNYLTKSYYQHHKFSSRSTKTKQNLRAIPIPQRSKPSSGDHLKPFDKVNSTNKSEQRKKTQLVKNESLKRYRIGRQIFAKQIKNNQHLGPGYYSPNVKRSESFGYIHRQIHQDQVPSHKFKQKIAQLIGPGKYNIQETQTFLSCHRNSQALRFSSQKLSRCILSKERAEKINLRIDDQNQIKQVWRRKLGPGCYNVQRSQFKNANFRKTVCYSVSMTERASLIRNQKLPGPGYYECYNFASSKQNQLHRKPKIQFKFVHGCI